jgi:hypothetical protein
MLNEFYDALQDAIERYKQKSDKAGWHIEFNDAMDMRRFSFFKVDDNEQYWYLNMNLKQINTNEYGSVVGDYEGEYMITRSTLDRVQNPKRRSSSAFGRI